MTMVLENLPTDELVAIAWIGSIPGFGTEFVATQLPDPARKDGTPADWVATPPYAFVTVAAVGGGEDDWLPIHRPVMQVDCWATRQGSNKPPWWRANKLAQHISRATRDRTAVNRTLTISANGVAYPSASVQRAAMMTSPRRMYDDVGDFARYQFDLQMFWIQLGETDP